MSILLSSRDITLRWVGCPSHFETLADLGTGGFLWCCGCKLKIILFVLEYNSYLTSNHYSGLALVMEIVTEAATTLLLTTTTINNSDHNTTI